VRLGLLIFCRKIVFDNSQTLKEKGPLLLACNHPNSFFDALILGAYFKQPVHFLARGDAFNNPFLRKVLTALKAIPIYRLKEGRENLALNDNTFERCLQILQQGGIVLIFSEGLCLNQWELRPLKKGTARIAINAWKQDSISSSFRILPVSLNYSSFTRFSKSVVIHFGDAIKNEHLPKEKTEAETIIELNKQIHSRLEQGIIVAKENLHLPEFIINNITNSKENPDVIASLKTYQQNIYINRMEAALKSLVGSKILSSNISRLFINVVLVILLLLPAVAGLLLHLPLYLPLNTYIKSKTKGTVFYHSALFGALIILYPLNIIILSFASAFIFSDFQFFFLMILMPVLALIFLQWKECVEGVFNYFRLSQNERRLVNDFFA
jgi:1-acyl-sn-glycerol-3-phosphate acyltransferase